MGGAASEMCRFVYDTTFGILGFWDPAKDYPHLNPPEEDFGQTLGLFGVGNGIYLVLPFLGPSTLRDTVGLGGDSLLTPMTYIDPAVLAWSLKAEESVNDLSFRIGQYEEMKDAAIEPYASFKDGYIQYRNKKISQ
jgi:phospholipid-binding lipoprotein MlaA